jgi:hypothetical protein
LPFRAGDLQLQLLAVGIRSDHVHTALATRVRGDRLWQRLRHRGDAQGTRTHDEHADMLWAAAERKRQRTAPDPQAMLVLDATGAPHIAIKDVVRSFRTRYGTRARALAFLEVWLAGHTAAATVRLDVQG